MKRFKFIYLVTRYDEDSDNPNHIAALPTEKEAEIFAQNRLDPEDKSYTYIITEIPFINMEGIS